MYTLNVVLILTFLISFSKSARVFKDRSDNLPPIFYIDDYEKCKAEDKLFCKVSVVLKKGNSDITYYWNIIEKSINDSKRYNHNELFHAICANDFCPDLKLQKKINRKDLSDCYNRKYNHLGLVADISNYNCSNHDNVYKANTLDYMWLTIVFSYGFYVFLASYWDYLTRNRNLKKLFISERFDEYYLKPFSLISNFEKLKNGNKSTEFQRLKSMQGIRFYNMLLIIFCHTFSSYIGGYVLNTDYFEVIDQYPFKLGLRNLMVFLVQTFFLFSAFLMSYHFFQIMETSGTFNKKYIFLTFLNRYLRILPPIVLMIGFGSTMWIVSLFYGPIKDLYSDLEYQRCQKNWWTTLLFINNHYNQYDMCYFITWYLAADTQLYMLSLVILSLIWKFRKSTWKILAFWVFTGILIPIIISYIYNLDIIYRITPENSKNNKFRSFQFNAIYSSSYANMATYMIGICAGYIYFGFGNKNIFNKLVYKILWLIVFIGLPTFVVIISSYHYSRFTGAILCGILKPLYAVGIAIGIFGMSQQIGGILKRICEWPPAIFMGNFTYSTYVVHYGIVFYRTATATKPYFVSDFILLQSFLIDAVISFLFGFIVHIMVEMPIFQIQNVIIPQVRKQRIDKKETKK